MKKLLGAFCVLSMVSSALAAEVVLPSGYTRLEYVQGDGATSRLILRPYDNRWTPLNKVTTTFYPNGDLIQLDFAMTEMGRKQCLWCGTYVTSVPNKSMVTWMPSQGFRYDYNNQVSDVFFGASAEAFTRYTVTATNNVAGLSDSDRVVRDVSGNFNTANPISVFASYTGGNNQGWNSGVGNWSSMRLYGLKIFGFGKNGSYTMPGLVCDLVPTRDPSGKIGFYNAAEKMLVEHYGTFIAGPAADAFRILEIEKQYYDGVTACTPHPIVLDATTEAVLAEGKDYTLAWSENDHSGRGTVTVTGVAGSAHAGKSTSVTFEIQRGIPFRPMSVTANMQSGAILSFDVTVGVCAGTTPLYLAYGPVDGGATTNGWANLRKVADITAAAQTVNVSIGEIPGWGGADAKYARFFLKPGSLFKGIQIYKNNANGKWFVSDYRLTSDDTMEGEFTMENASRYGAHMFGGYDRAGKKPRMTIAYCGGDKMKYWFGDNESGQGFSKETAASKAIYSSYCRAELQKDHCRICTNDMPFFSSDFTYAGEAFTMEEPLILFYNTNYAAQVANNFGPERGGIGYVSVTRGGETTCMLYPCTTNGVTCFYDAAAAKFCTDGRPTGSSSAIGSDDHGPVSASIRYTESPLPEIADAYAVATNLVSGRLFGMVQKAGYGATGVDVYFACAVKGTEMPELQCVQTGLVAGDAITAPFAGLTEGLDYDYVIDLRNSLGYSLAAQVTGSFVARPAHTWTGGAGNDDFMDAANWDIGAPQEGADVTLPAGVAAILSRPTPALHSLAVDGTLTMSNWLTKVEAGVVTVRNGGKMTCAGPFSDTETSNRVWIVCTDLTVEAGGVIDVNDRGYDGARALRTRGYGPGTCNGAGASHGGYGGGPLACRKAPYGNAEDPTAPGSGGDGGASNIGTPGGGAVKVDATGRVTVNGSILASATKTLMGTYNTHGSGGSISIGCASFAGTNGKLLAEGSESTISAGKENGAYPGGGGRIAVRTTAQEDGLVSGMTISVREGLFKNTPRNNQDAVRTQADLGTLWFTDMRLLESLGTGISGQILNFTEYEFDDFTMTSGHVRLAAEGVKLTVAGDLAVSGANARLELGGYCVTNRVMDFSPYCGTTPVELAVGGDMTIAEGGRFDVYSAKTNGLGSVGAKLDVTGTLTVGAASKLTAGCDEVNGGAPKFMVGNLVVEETGVFTADARGFAGGTSMGSGGPDKSNKGKGPGGGDRIGTGGNVSQNKYIGGGYGGIGGWSVTGGSTSGLSYGDEWRPSLPGSGGAGQTWSSNGGAGGGVIDVTASGFIRIDGTVSANGSYFYMQDLNVGGGSGGSIWLKTPVFSGAATGVISANGQDRSNVFNGGAGGGGRIAIWTGSLPYDGKVTKSRVHKQATAFTMPDGTTYAGAISVAGGTNPKEESGDADGADGTCWFVDVDKPGGLMLLLR